MKVNENILRDALRDAIADVEKRPSTFTAKMKTTMSHMFNITGGETAFILNGRTPVDTMSDAMMYKVSVVLHELIVNDPSNYDVTRLDVDKYYTEDEKKAYKKKIDRKVVDKDIIRKRWVPIANDQISTGFTNKELAKLVSIDKIHYNPETQRNLTIIETPDGDIKKVTVFTEAYESICEKMQSDGYIPDTLTFNINPDFNITPKIVGEEVIIPKDAIIDCIDGYHRLKAAITVSKLNPDWEITFPVMLTMFDVKKAREYIIQENYKNLLTDEQVKEYDQDDAANFIIDKMKSSIYLKNSKISDISYQLNNIINSVFKPERLKSPDKIQQALNLFKSIEKNMNNLIEDKDLIGKIFTVEEWFVYLYLINYSVNNNSDFISIINKIDTNELLKQIKITKKPVTDHYKIMSEVISNASRR